MQRVLERLALFAPGREASAPRPLDPGLAVRKAVALARFGKGGPLEVRLAEGVPRVLADETELLHLLLLLLLHAQEASQGEERVEVSLEADALGAVVRVRDCGPAPSDEELGRLFDPFHASARRDRGLGLSVAFELARHSGGRLEAERHPRGGVVVSLRLPPAEAS
jgi:signal transduction histidine kinase